MIALAKPKRITLSVMITLGGSLLLGGLGWKTIAAGEGPIFGYGGTIKKNVTAEELRKLYPFESLKARLEYEHNAKVDKVPSLSAEAQQRLEAADQAFSRPARWGGGNVRAESLQKLHSSEVAQFIARDGFGNERLPTPSPRYLELPPAPSIPFGSVSYKESTIEQDPRVSLPAQGPPSGTLRLLSTEAASMVHELGQASFLSAASFGYAKSRDGVAGFRPHEFRFSPVANLNPNNADGKEKNKERWVLRRLELVSLLKHEKPVVYVSQELPRMENLRRAPTRPLGDFEEKALKNLQGGQDLVTEATVNRIRMLGALRASRQCLQCHNVQHGQLLGSFSYELLRDPALRVW
jgi:hypothetical protein